MQAFVQIAALALPIIYWRKSGTYTLLKEAISGKVIIQGTRALAITSGTKATILP